MNEKLAVETETQPGLDVAIPQNYPLFKLSEEEVADPSLVIEDFFSFAHLPEIRQMLWEWFKTTVTGSFPKDLYRNKRQEIVLLYEHLEKLVEAAHLLNHQRLVNKYDNHDN